MLFFSGDENKLKYAERKEELKIAFQERLGLRVYVPLPHGGTSNTGNVARKAFENAAIFSEITGFPVDLIEDLDLLIQLMSSGQKFDPKIFETLANDWLRRFHGNDEVNWHWPSPSIHCLLVHGTELLIILPCAPGLTSEEASEHANKVQYLMLTFKKLKPTYSFETRLI